MATGGDKDLFDDALLRRWGFKGLFALVVVAYVPAMNGEFITDDFYMIKSPKTITSLGAVGDVFRTGFTFDPDNEPTPKKSREQVTYRPISITILLTLKTLFGSNTFPYHLFNLCLHLLACFLALLLARHWLEGVWPRFLAVTFFALHPFCTDAVAWINGLSDPLVFVFLGAAMVAMVRCTKLWHMAAAIFLGFFCALLCKETALVFIAAVPVLSFWHLKSAKKTALLCGAALVALVAYVVLRQWALGSGGAGMPGSAEQFAFILQAPVFSLWMIYKIFTLLDLSIHIRNVAISNADGIWVSALGVVFYVGLSAWALRSLIRKQVSRTLVLLLLFMFFMMPVTYQHSVFHASPRSFYIPIFFLALLLGILFDAKLTTLSPKIIRTQKLFIYALSAFLFFSTLGRSFDYRSDNHIMAADLQESPDEFQAHYYYAKRLMVRKRFAAALEVAQRAVELNPRHLRAQNNLAYCYLNLGQTDRAYARYQHIITIDEYHCNARYHLGLLESQKNRLDQARGHLHRVSDSCYNHGKSIQLLRSLGHPKE